MTLFDETAKWKILCFFFQKPEREAYVRQVAREAKLNEGSSSTLCRELEKEGMLAAEKKGNALFYALQGKNPLVKRLKSAWFLERLLKHKSAWEKLDCQSIALYGSRASGDFISKSDADILVLTSGQEKDVERAFEGIGQSLGAEVSLSVLSVPKWVRMAREKDRFYIEVISNHILLAGELLVIG
jgi:predicted nucleotidyltransferase